MRKESETIKLAIIPEIEAVYAAISSGKAAKYPDVTYTFDSTGEIHLTFFAFNDDRNSVFAAVGITPKTNQEVRKKYQEAQQKSAFLIAELADTLDGTYTLTFRTITLNEDNADLFRALKLQNAFAAEP